MGQFKIPDVCIYGDEHIDLEHQAIVDLILGLEGFTDENENPGLGAHCKNIRSTIANHFLAEEVLMKKVDYSEAHQHHVHHVEMLKVANRILSLIETRGHAIDRDIERFIGDVVKHMLMDDISFRDHLLHIGWLMGPPKRQMAAS
jgi:hemerythrin-like metal-binding protein